MTMNEPHLYERIYAVVRQIPRGQVATYGQIARIVGGISAQMVGFALAALRGNPADEDVPWQRVVNAKGKISPHGMGFGSLIQRDLLEDEGVMFDVEGCLDFDLYRWQL
jgi:methylated-DNA-protein-cysteine methyltransferase-like protein